LLFFIRNLKKANTTENKRIHIKRHKSEANAYYDNSFNWDNVDASINVLLAITWHVHPGDITYSVYYCILLNRHLPLQEVVDSYSRIHSCRPHIDHPCNTDYSSIHWCPSHTTNP